MKYIELLSYRLAGISLIKHMVPQLPGAAGSWRISVKGALISTQSPDGSELIKRTTLWTSPNKRLIFPKSATTLITRRQITGINNLETFMTNGTGFD